MENVKIDIYKFLEYRETRETRVQCYKPIDVIKERVREKIQDEFANPRGIKCYTRLSFSNWKLRINEASIWNNHNQIQGHKPRWLNKVTVSVYYSGEYTIRSHVVRTDPKFLIPTDKEFLDYITNLQKEIDDIASNYV